MNAKETTCPILTRKQILSLSAATTSRPCKKKNLWTREEQPSFDGNQGMGKIFTALAIIKLQESALKVTTIFHIKLSWKYVL
jgi:hypothetical protein